MKGSEGKWWMKGSEGEGWMKGSEGKGLMKGRETGSILVEPYISIIVEYKISRFKIMNPFCSD